MLEVIGDILPSAVGVAISPIPIIAVILMLMSPRPKQLGLGFLAGWLLGVLIATGVFTLLTGVLPEPSASGGSQPVIAVIQLVLGVLLLLLAVRQWRSRPAAGTEPKLPGWMAKIDSMKPLAAIGLAFALAAVNPKNLLLAAAAGSVIGRGDLDPAEQLIVVLIFGVLAALTVAIPVVSAVVAPQRAAATLAGVRAWLTAHNAVIMMVLFVVLGAQIIGKALGSF